MGKVRILAIAPYHGLAELMNQVASERGDLELTALVGNLDEGLRLAQKAVAESDYDIILSRGGTAELISSHLDVPILEIAISLGDILQAVKLAENYNRQFAIVGYPSITRRARLICDLLDYHIPVHTVQSHAELPDALASLAREGVELFIGDAVTCTIARKMAFNVLLITSNAENIATAFDQAVRLGAGVKRTWQQLQIMTRYADKAPIKSLIFDDQGSLLYDNLSDLPDCEELRALVRQELPSFQSKSCTCLERQIGKSRILLEGVIDTAVDPSLLIVHLRFLQALPAFKAGAVSSINRTEAMRYDFGRYYGFSGTLDDLGNRIERYAQDQTPVIILGEQGTGKDSVAQYMYSIGKYADRPLYTVDFSLVNEKLFSQLLEHPDSPMSGLNITLYFKNISSLDAARMEEFLCWAKQSDLAHRCRILFSFVLNAEDPNAMARADRISSSLSALSLMLPPLRMRSADIASLATLFIGQLNIDLGKQIIGFEPQALSKLSAYDWPNNLDQFHRVLRGLVGMTTSYHILEKDVETVLWEERQQYTPTAVSDLDLDRPLTEITRDVVRMVLKRENNNQKRAAEKLGIGRTTIWRILKTDE